ncbi:MAG: hypothetical protein QXL01_00445, partial [Thermoplasmatales archaeon]
MSNNKLAKGAMRKIFGKYNPRDPGLDAFKDMIRNWIGTTVDNTVDHRKIIAENFKDRPMAESERARVIHKLHNQTQVRKNPETGEREFLLHRGASSDEVSSADLGTHIGHNKHTSWTPNYLTAHSFALEHQHAPGPDSINQAHDRVLSAWISEKSIV